MINSSTLAPLRRRDFRLLLGGQSISWIGNNFYEIAIMWLVLNLTGSTAAMAGVAAISTIPQLIFAPFAGVIADRVNRRSLALSMDLCRGLIILILPTLQLLHHLAVWQIYITAFVLFSLFAFFIPAREAMLPNVVPDEELPGANALFQIITSAALLIGFGLGGLVVAYLGVVPALYLDSLSFGASVLSLLLIRSAGRTAAYSEAKTSMLKEVAAGLRFIRSQPVLLAVFGFIGVAGLFVGPLLILPAPFSRSVLHAGARGYGFLEASFMLGTITGALASGLLTRTKRLGLLLIGVAAAAGLLLVVMSYASVLPVAAAIYLSVGLVTGCLDIPLMTLMQRLTPDEMRGRVFSLMILVNGAGTPLSVVIGGTAAQQVGVAAMYRIVGLLFVAISVAFMFTPILRIKSDDGQAGEPNYRLSGTLDSTVAVDAQA